MQGKIAMIGAGSWGGAVALYLARRGLHVCMWTIETDHALQMQTERSNQRFLPGFEFPDSLEIETSLENTLKECEFVVLGIPSHAYKITLEKIKPFIHPTSQIIALTKGLDPDTAQPLHLIFEQTLGDLNYAVLSGPSFALEVAKGLPTAVVVASKSDTYAERVATLFNSEIFRTYYSTDIVGVEIGGAAKNVIAIAAGISDGLGFGTNTRCALITRGLAEITNLAVSLGASPQTLSGLAGLGDLVLTCTDNQSRNRRYGLGLGKGLDSDAVEKEIAQVVEGKHNAILIQQLAKSMNVHMPITETVQNIIQGKLSVNHALNGLLGTNSTLEWQ